MCIASFLVKSVLLEGMGKVKFKSLPEIYERTQKISPPTEPSQFHLATDMHFEQVASTVVGRTGGSTGEAFEGKRASHCPSTNNFPFSPSFRQCASSEASKICSVSTSLNSSFESSESQANFQDSCKPIGQSLDSPKDLINFDDQRFPNQLEKCNEFEFLGDNISCISKSESTNLAIGNQNNDAEKKTASSSLASVDSLPAVGNDVNDRLDCLYPAGNNFYKYNSSHCGIQNFAAEPPPTTVVSLPNRSDQSNYSSIKDIYDSAVSLEQDPSECSAEQVESSLARAVINGLSGGIEGIHNYATFGKADHQLNSEDPNIETESHSHCERHLQKSVAVVVKNSMREPRQSQPVDPRGVSDLIEDEARVCDICGDLGREHQLAFCSKCTDGAEHIYCMHVKLEKVPEGDWVCEECLLMTDSGKPKQDALEEAVRISKGCLECQISGNSINHEPRSSGRFNFRSSGSGISGTNNRSSTSQLSASRPATTLEALSVKEARAVGMSPVSPMSSKSCTPTVLCEDFSFKNLTGKMEDATCITSALRSSTTSQEKAGIPCAYGYKKDAGNVEAELKKKRRTLETTVASPRASKLIKHSLLSREGPLKNLESEKMEDDGSVCRLFETTDLKLKGQRARGECLQKQKIARNSAFHDDKVEKDSRMASKYLSFDSVSSGNADAAGSKACPRKDSHSDATKKFSHAEEQTAKENDRSELCDPAMRLPASDSGVTAVEVEKETISCKQFSISRTNCYKLDAVESCGKSDHRLKPTSNITHVDLNCPNEKEINKSWQAECPAEATSYTRLDEVRSDFPFNEMSKIRKLPQFDMANTSATNAVPEDRYIWLGKFQIHSSKGPARSFDGIQSHLSTKASPKVLEMVDQFAEILLLEELPRLSIWPSQFVDRHVTEDNIALYFFAKDLRSHTTSYTRLLNYMKENDLAFRGNFDGVELLIFSSNVLPENLKFWNTLNYLWGVFRVQKVPISANATGSNSPRNENRDCGRRWTLDLNVCPPDEEDQGRVPHGSRCLDIHRCEFDANGTIYRGVGTQLGGDGCSSGFSVHMNNSKPEVVDLELSLWPQNAVYREMEVDTQLSP